MYLFKQKGLLSASSRCASTLQTAITSEILFSFCSLEAFFALTRPLFKTFRNFNLLETSPFLTMKNVIGGYHPNEDSEEAWEGLNRDLAAAAPEVPWARLPSFRMCYDDPFSVPFGETCRSSIGYIVSKTCGGKCS